MSVLSGLCRDINVSSIAKSIERDGFSVLENYVSDTDIKYARKSIEDAVRCNGNESVGKIENLDQFEDTFVYALTQDSSFISLCRGVYSEAFGVAAPDTKLVPSLRCLSGRSGREQSMIFHYDSYVLAALIPIIIPKDGKKGRLIVCPNTRTVRRTYLSNFMDKLITDSAPSQRRYREMYQQRSDKLRYIDVEPGNLYFFWGYRSVHTNEECNPDKIRSTAIFHYHDPHADSSLKKLLKMRHGVKRQLAGWTSH